MPVSYTHLVLDKLVLICSRIIQLDGIGYIECSVQVEIMLMVVRVELHSLHVCLLYTSVYFVGILRVREIIQEIFEDRNRFAESGKGSFMDQQRIIEHGYCLNLFVE